MNVFDLIVLAILAALTLRGIWKGMISQIVSVISLFVCWIVATRFGGLIAPTIPVEAPWNQVLAMAVIFVITWIAVQFAYAALEKLIKHWHLQKLNTLLGGLLGFTKGLLLCLIITFFAVMFSETSRAVVFNSLTGFHLVQLITQISVFVPKDSYEFVHDQLAQFQNKVEGAVPGQTPDLLRVQSSETMKQMLAQLQQTTGTSKTDTDSLWIALSKWWNGVKDNSSAETLTSTPQTQTVQKAVPYIPPMPPALPTNTYTSHTPPPTPPQPSTTLPLQPITPPQPAVAVEDYFIKRPEPTASPSMPSLTALSPAVPVSPDFPSALSPLTTLAPLNELPMLLESEIRSLPIPPAPSHVGSELLLHNSGQTTKPDASAKVFRSW